MFVVFEPEREGSDPVVPEQREVIPSSVSRVDESNQTSLIEVSMETEPRILVSSAD